LRECDGDDKKADQPGQPKQNNQLVLAHSTIQAFAEDLQSSPLVSLRRLRQPLDTRHWLTGLLSLHKSDRE